MDPFIDSFLRTKNEVPGRMVDEEDFGEELDNEDQDVPLYDQFNTGLALTQASRPRINLSLDPELSRCRLTGTIPSAEMGVQMGALPQPRKLMIDLNGSQQ